MTRITMAALPIVEEIDGESVWSSVTGVREEKDDSLHIATTLPPTAFPKERYPVTPTSIYKKAAAPILVVTTAVVLKCELLLISLSMENI